MEEEHRIVTRDGVAEELDTDEVIELIEDSS